MKSRGAERGSALAMALACIVVLFGVSSSYLVLSFGGYQNARLEAETVRARFAAEEGVHRSLAELKDGVDASGDGLGDIDFTGSDGRVISVVATDLGGGLYSIRSTGTDGRARSGLEVTAQATSPTALSFPPRAAITAQGPVAVTGSIVVDGRDWNEWGTSIVGPGTFGISSMGAITNSGNAKVGGKGIAPAKPPPAATKEPMATWRDLVNNDGDGATDEEQFDGQDDDGDGKVDEDTTGYPASPDVMMSLPEGSLKQAAIAAGTYFTSQASLDAYLATNGGNVPGGIILFADFTDWLPVNLGSTLNADPSIIVHHNSTGTSQMKNVHGSFKGLILADFVQHLNGDFLLVGALMSFGDEAYGNAFGNGNAQVKFSSTVLSALPSSQSATTFRVLSWRKVAAALPESP